MHLRDATSTRDAKSGLDHIAMRLIPSWTVEIFRTDFSWVQSMSERYYSNLQFCERVNVSSRQAARWRQSGEGPPFVRLGQRKIAYRDVDVEEWAAQRTFRHRADEVSRRQK